MLWSTRLFFFKKNGDLAAFRLKGYFQPGEPDNTRLDEFFFNAEALKPWCSSNY